MSFILQKTYTNTYYQIIFNRNKQYIPEINWSDVLNSNPILFLYGK